MNRSRPKGVQRSQSTVPKDVRKKQNSGKATQVDAAKDRLAIANAVQFTLCVSADHVNWLNEERRVKP